MYMVTVADSEENFQHNFKEYERKLGLINMEININNFLEKKRS